MVHSFAAKRVARRLSFEEFEAKLCLCASFATHESHDVEVPKASNVFAADLDGDGDNDVVYTSFASEDGWLENVDGIGQHLVRHVDIPGAVSAADIDGDGDMDVLSSFGWYENTDGKGNFGPERRGGGGPVAADLDGDGDRDTLRGDSWFENIDGRGQFRRRVVTRNEGVIASSAADVDGDGDLDILSASRDVSSRDGTIEWYENTDGKGAFGRQNVISAEFLFWPVVVNAADVDGDGDVDVLSGSEVEGVAWYENIDGRGGFGPQQTVSRWPSGMSEVLTADLDGDGDLDIVSADYGNGDVVWHANTDGKGTFGEEQVIAIDDEQRDDSPGIWSVHAADMDGDGDLDVLSANYGSDRIRWYRNLHGEHSVGDANLDGQFNQLDIVQALQSDTYLTGENATFQQGDWNGDTVFNQLDILKALHSGNYLRGRLCG